jgi:hypothetical protein
MGRQFRDSLTMTMRKDDYKEESMAEFLEKCWVKLIEKARDEENNSEL